MITVLGTCNGKYEVIELPAFEGTLQKFYAELGAETPKDIRIQYAGTGKDGCIDALLLENSFETEPPSVGELNLLAYLAERMSEEQMDEYNDNLEKYTYDFGKADIVRIINEAYDIFGEDSEKYNGDNLTELLIEEREQLSAYPQMNKDIFWEMIDTVRQKYGSDYKAAEEELTGQLSCMHPQDIIMYLYIYDAYMQAADQDDIYELGCRLNKMGGIGDDSFTDFRAWLIGQGKEVYMEIVKSPISIVSFHLEPTEDNYFWETFNYVAAHAYNQRTGQVLYEAYDSQSQLKVQNEIVSELATLNGNSDPEVEHGMNMI